MSTAFEKIGTDRQLQDHWVRRLIATIIDGIIVSILVAILWAIITLPLLATGTFVSPWYFNWLALPSFIIGLLWLLYASFMESAQGSTFGKQIMNLKVTTADGRIPTFAIALTRNVSKIYFLLLLLDVVIGMATAGDPHQKYTDRIAGTTLVSTIARSLIVPMPPSPPTPPSPPST